VAVPFGGRGTRVLGKADVGAHSVALTVANARHHTHVLGSTLDPMAGDDHDLIVDNVVSIFGKIFSKHWGPRIDACSAWPA